MRTNGNFSLKKHTKPMVRGQEREQPGSVCAGEGSKQAMSDGDFGLGVPGQAGPARG